MLGCVQFCKASGSYHISTRKAVVILLSAEITGLTRANCACRYCYARDRAGVFINLDSQQLRRLAKAADHLAMLQALTDVDCELAEQCKSKLSKPFLKVKNVIGWAEDAARLQLPKLLKCCEKFMLAQV